MPGASSKDKKQPWKAFESSFGRGGAAPITYDAPRGAKLKIPGTSGELSLDILYDTADLKGKRETTSKMLR
jgi:hypothetical protein